VQHIQRAELAASVPSCCSHQQQWYSVYIVVCDPQVHAQVPDILTTSEACQPAQRNFDVFRGELVLLKHKSYMMH